MRLRNKGMAAAEAFILWGLITLTSDAEADKYGKANQQKSLKHSSWSVFHMREYPQF
ncbi:hypothetical protein PAXINDRAFT_20145 [Paxillus involutus ATCC 200175]|uniref:Uncharacterized protein n=1 Tax=Paxillus involutus ATCC 200175 TaxID=664439 RepID=A0A0C9SVM3_PAXIN|nr:hypothetical protein PAXINDRAFT_20145 [Paxillus involutus ATCC 200175]